MSTEPISDYRAALLRIKETLQLSRQDQTELAEKMDNKKIEKTPSTHRVDELV